MDEEQMEKRYYRRLRLRNYIILVDMYALIFCILAPPISHFDSRVWDIAMIYMPTIFIVIGLIVPRLLVKSYGFWYSVPLKVKAESSLIKGFAVMTLFFSFSMTLVLYIFMPDFFFASPQLIAGALSISPFGPIIYFLRKLNVETDRKKYGNTRAIKIKSDAKKARKLVEDVLNNFKLGYREEKEGSKLCGFREFYVLDSGIRITVEPLGPSSTLITISNIPDDDTLEKQIEREILRLLALQS